MEFAVLRLEEHFGEAGGVAEVAVKLDGDTFTQTGTLTNGKPLSEVWKRVGH